MKKFFVVAAVLFCAVLAWSQPDARPGLTQGDLLKNQARDAMNKLNRPLA